MSAVLYLKIGTSGFGAGEMVLRKVIVPTMLKAGCWEISQFPTWYFLRYLDATGFHLRLRVHGEPVRLQEVEMKLRESLQAFSGEDRSAISYVRRAVYVPEWGKWGGVLGVQSAERVFGESSRFVVSLSSEYWDSRLGLALLLFKKGVELLPSSQQTSFIYNYAWYWSGGGNAMSSSMLDFVRRTASKLEPHLYAQSGSWETERQISPNRLEKYLTALEGDIMTGTNPAHRLFHHLHLTANRLGVFPHDEAILAAVLQFKGSKTRL